MAQDGDFDSDPVLLMVTTSGGDLHSETWYLDIGCLNHMTCHKDLLNDLDTSKKTQIKLADNRALAAEGMGNIVIKKKDGKATLIEDVLFIPGMKCNLMSLGQLIEKGFSIIIKHDYLELYDQHQRLVLKSPWSKNITFQTTIRPVEVKCLTATEENKKSWLWHLKFGYLNFRSLNQ